MSFVSADGSSGMEQLPSRPNEFDSPKIACGGDTTMVSNNMSQLFGDDEDEEEPAPLFNKDDDAGPDQSDEDLFGEEDSIHNDNDYLTATSNNPEQPVGAPVLNLDTAQRIELNDRPRPSLGRQFMCVRLPRHLRFEKNEFTSGPTNDKKESRKEVKDPNECIAWRFKRGRDGKVVMNDKGLPERETNTKWIRWSDGTQSLVVGSQMFDCQVNAEAVLLFESSETNYQVVHCAASHKVILRSTLGAQHMYKPKTPIAATTLGRKTRLTTVEEARQSERISQRKLEETWELDQMSRRQRDAALEARKGLRAQDLENSDSDDGTSIGRIKQLYGYGKKNGR